MEQSLPWYAKRFIAYWKTLTAAQRQAIRLYYFENDEKKPKRKIAKKIGISVDALKDRLEGALRKLDLHFYPLIPSHQRRPAYWKTLFQALDRRDRGLFVKSSAAHRHPVYRIDLVTGEKTGEITGQPSKTRTPQVGWAESKAWERVTTYWPRHDGVASSLLAHLPNRFNYEQRRKMAKENRRYEVYVTADAKTAFDQVSQQLPKKSKRKSGEVLFDQQWLDQTTIDDREADDLDADVNNELE